MNENTIEAESKKYAYEVYPVGCLGSDCGNACTNNFCNKDINNAFIAGAEFAKNENEIIEMTIANFENIEKMAERLTSGNVSHDGATIKGIAHRNVEYLRSYLSEQSTQGQQSTNSTI